MLGEQLTHSLLSAAKARKLSLAQIMRHSINSGGIWYQTPKVVFSTLTQKSKNPQKTVVNQ